MTFHEEKKSIVTDKGVEQKSPIHREVTMPSSSVLSKPFKYQIVYVDVVLPMGTTRIFGILHEGKVYTKVSAFAPTGVSDPKQYSLLSDRDYNVYKQWLQVKSNSKTRKTAEQMQWVESNAEKLIKEGKEKQSKADDGQKSYEYAQKLNEEFQIPVSSLKVGNRLEFQFNKSLWTVTKIIDNTLYAIQDSEPNNTERSIGTKGIVRGYKLI